MNGIKRSETGDLYVENGHLVITDIIDDVVEVVMMSQAGELKHKPTIGANLNDAVNGTVDALFPQETKRMLIGEQINVQEVKVENGNVDVII